MQGIQVGNLGRISLDEKIWEYYFLFTKFSVYTALPGT